MLDPSPDLPAVTLIAEVGFPTIVRNALILAGLNTIGDIRSASDGELQRIRRIGPGRLVYIRLNRPGFAGGCLV